MALIQCSECGHNVSDKASSCPNCGCPVSEMIKEIPLPNKVTAETEASETAEIIATEKAPKKKRKKLKPWAIALLAVFAVIIILVAVLVGNVIKHALLVGNSYVTITPYLEYVGEYVPEGETLKIESDLYDNLQNVEFMGMKGEITYKYNDYVKSCTWTSFGFYSVNVKPNSV